MKFLLVSFILSCCLFNANAEDNSCMANVRLANPGPDYKYICVNGRPTKVLKAEVQSLNEPVELVECEGRKPMSRGHKTVCVNGEWVFKKSKRFGGGGRPGFARPRSGGLKPNEDRSCLRNLRLRNPGRDHRYICVNGKHKLVPR